MKMPIVAKFHDTGKYFAFVPVQKQGKEIYQETLCSVKGKKVIQLTLGKTLTKEQRNQILKYHENYNPESEILF